jgi:hypothetical protein
LMVDAQNQQLVGMALVVNPKRRHAPTPHGSTRTKS